MVYAFLFFSNAFILLLEFPHSLTHLCRAWLVDILIYLFSFPLVTSGISIHLIPNSELNIKSSLENLILKYY